jgi:murein DD-endopeptidase MepM/ murein hydrolase activator NlpD
VKLASEKVQSAKVEPVKASPVKEPAVKVASEKVQSVKTPSVDPVKVASMTEPPAKLQAAKIPSIKIEPVKTPSVQEPTVNVQLSNGPMEMASTRLADGFDFPVGKPDAEGYYKARGFRSGGHMGEDWDGVGGGDTDLKDPIYSIGDGIVVFARDVHLGWGNVVIVRHAYRENGTVKHIDALYGHLHSIMVKRGQRVTRGQQVGTMGTAHGQYDAHLHLEIRKNLEIGMSRAKFQKNLTNYHDPTQFIASHRRLSGGGASFQVAMNTFTHDAARRFDKARNFSARKRSTAQSSAALKRALSSATR